MEQLRSIVLDAVAGVRDAAAPFRLRYAGYPIDTAGLAGGKYRSYRVNASGLLCWEKRQTRDCPRIRLFVLNGLLADIRIAQYLDYTDLDGIGAPCGWFAWHLSPYGVRALEKLLAAAVAVPDRADPAADAQRLIECLRLAVPEVSGFAELSVELCGFAEMVLNEAPHLAALITQLLLRHADRIDRRALLDLPLVCRRLRLYGECVQAIRAVMALEAVDAETLTNIGAALCDDFDQPRAALACFTRAIAQEPALAQPREDLWVAGGNALRELVQARHFAEAVAVYEEVNRLGAGHAPAGVHGFWSFAGLAHEGAGDLARALELYRHVLAMDPDCRQARPGFARLQAGRGGADDPDFHSAVNRLDREAPNRYGLTEDVE